MPSKNSATTLKLIQTDKLFGIAHEINTTLLDVPATDENHIIFPELKKKLIINGTIYTEHYGFLNLRKRKILKIEGYLGSLLDMPVFVCKIDINELINNLFCVSKETSASDLQVPLISNSIMLDIDNELSLNMDELYKRFLNGLFISNKALFSEMLRIKSK